MLKHSYRLLAALTALLLLASVKPSRAAETPDLICQSVPEAGVLGSAQLLTEGLASAQNKNWQPAGGNITFTIQSFTPFDADASIIACLRWKTVPKGDAPWARAPILRHDLSTADKRTLTVTIEVPHLDVAKAAQKYEYALPFHLVPRADVRILIRNPGAKHPVAVDGTMGITHPVFAIFATAVVFVLSFVGLWFVVRRRLRTVGIASANPILTDL